MRCSSCGREKELEPGDSRVCLSFGGLDPRKELLAGRMIDPCRGRMTYDGEAWQEPMLPPLDLQIQSIDIATKTYPVKQIKPWKGPRAGTQK